MGRATIIIGLLYAMAGLAFLTMALAYKGYFLLLLWPAAGFLILSAGYLYFGPVVYFKAPDGQQKLWARIIHFPGFLFNRITWKIGRLTKPDDLWNEIVPDVFLGRKLTGKSQLPDNIALVIDLTAEYLEPEDIKTSVDYKCVPTLDGTAMISDNFAEVLDYAANKQAVTYIHCAVGHGRAAMFVACLLIRSGICSDAEEAERLIKTKRPRVHLRPAHKKVIDFHGSSQG